MLRNQDEMVTTAICLYERTLMEKIMQLMVIKNTIVEMVETLGNSNERIVLELRYLNGLEWEQIAMITNYSLRNVMRCHSTAIKSLEENRPVDVEEI